MTLLQSKAGWNRAWLAPLLAFPLALFVYWPALQGTRVWDDDAHLTAPALQSWHGLVRIWSELGATQQYYPVLHSAFWVEHRLWGDAPVGYHLINVLFHATSACLLAVLLRRLGRNRALPPALPLLSAALFIVHPLGVESVAWISEQKNTLSLLLSLLSVLAYLDFDERRSRAAYVAAVVFFLAALGAKSVTAILPAAMLVILWWKNGRLEFRRDVAPLLPWFGAGLAAGVTTAWIERTLIGAHGGDFDLTVIQRVALSGRIVWFDVAKVVAPYDLMFIYPRWLVPAGWSAWLFLTVAAVGVTAVFFWRRRASPGVLALWLLYVGPLVPALGFLNVYPFRFSYVADHFQYHALPAAMILLGAVLLRVTVRLPAAARGLPGLALVAGLGLLSRAQSADYADGPTLYRATLARNPGCWLAHNNLAVDLARSPAGWTEATQHYEAALALKPDYADARNNYGLFLEHQPGHVREAIAQFTEALRIQPDLPEAEINLGNTLADLPDGLDAAIGHYRKAVRIQPDLAAAHYGLANALARQPGAAGDALAEYRETLRLAPDWVEARVNHAAALAREPGRLNDAVAELEAALHQEPRLAKAHYDLANLLSDLPGRDDDARRHYAEALRLQPNYPAAANNLGILEAKAGRDEIARLIWRRVLELDPGNADAAGNLRRLEQRTRP